MTLSPIEIRGEKVLAVEGLDEVNFFKALIEKLGYPEIDIFDIGGQSQFKKKLPTFVSMSGFSKVKSLGIIRDAENDKDSTFKSVQSTLRKCKLPVPNEPYVFSEGLPKIGVYIMPGTSEGRMLEDLCLMTVEDNPVMECITSYCNCVSQAIGPIKNLEKAKCQVFLAAMPEIVSSIGLAAMKDYWNFGSPCLEKLKSFLRML